jgi:hypothetical protein
MGMMQNLVSIGSMQRAASMLDPVDIEAVTVSRRAATSARQQKHRQKKDLPKKKKKNKFPYSKLVQMSLKKES